MIRWSAVLAILALITLSGMLHAQTPGWEWALQAGGTGSEQATNIIPDRAGGVYVCGRFSDTAQFGGDTIASFGSNDIFLARYSANGQVLWVTPMGSAGNDTPGGIAVDPSGNVYVTGSFTETVNFPQDYPGLHAVIQIHSDGGNDFFVAKYDSNGRYITSTSRRGIGKDNVTGIASDRSGNIYLVGSFTDTMSLGEDIRVVSSGGTDMFLARMAPGGTFDWVETAGGPNDDISYSVAVDDAGRAYISGVFDGYITIRGKTLAPNFDQSTLLACFNPDGTVAWMKGEDGRNLYGPVKLASDRSGIVYTAGTFRDELAVGTKTFQSQGEADVYVASFDHDGNFRWANQIGGSFIETVADITTDIRGDVYVTGTSQDLADGDIYVSKYTPGGVQQWQQSNTHAGITFGGGAYCNAVGVDAQGTVFIAGGFGAQLAFGKTLLQSIGSSPTSSNGYDVFLAKLGSTLGVDAVATAHGVKVLGNAPNPCSNATTLRIELEKPASVRVQVIGLRGNVVRAIDAGRMEPGTHDISLNTSDFSPGYYLINYQINGVILAEPMEVVR